MAKNKLKIEFTSNVWEYIFGIWIQVVGHPVFYCSISVGLDPLFYSHVPVGITTDETAQNIKTFLDSKILESSLQDYITTQVIGATLEITSGTDLIDSKSCCNFLSDYLPEDVLFTNELGVACAIQGSLSNGIVTNETLPVQVDPNTTPIGTFNLINFNGNVFNINNDIIIEVPNNTNGLTNRVKITFKNTDTNKIVNPIVLYPANLQNAKVNISPIIKALFEKPKQNTDYSNLFPFEIQSNNVANIEISIYRYFTPTGSVIEAFDLVVLNKVFIRAGKRSNDFNITTPINTPLRPVFYLPIWKGYPVAEYTLNANFKIVKNINLPSVINKDYIRVMNCENFYFKFLNQNGGYSNWLFQVNEETESNNNLGYSNNYANVNDFGNESNIKNSVKGMIKKEYIALFNDLIISPEIYLYTGGNTWKRVISVGNKSELMNTKKVYEVEFDYEVPTNFNPSTTW